MPQLHIRWVRAAALALVMAAAAMLSVALYGTRPTLPAGITVGDWAVGGLPIDEFERQLAAKQRLLMAERVRLSAAPASVSGPAAAPQTLTAERTLEQLGLELASQELLSKLAPLREGSPLRRAIYRWGQRGADWTPPARFAEAKLAAALREAFAPLYAREPVDARRVVEANDTIRYIPEVPAVRIDEAALLRELERLLPGWGTMEWTAGLPLGRGEAGPDGGSPAGEAVQAASSGSSDTADADADGGVIAVAVPLRLVQPPVTVETLKAQGIERKLAEYTTRYPPSALPASGSAGRLHNVKSTAASIQDVVLKPGELFDYATFIKQTEKRFGFREAPVILNGKLVPGIGGGICQVSSTLYNAVLRAGLAVVERRNHSLPVSYVPLGLDATFASGHINFKFRNSTEHHLLIRTYADDTKLTVKLFGQAPQDVAYEIESKTLETLQPPVKYVRNPKLPQGKQQLITRGKPGYVVETYRHKKQNGVRVATELISRDTYAAQPTIMASNVGDGKDGRSDQPPPSPSKPLVEDGLKGPTFR